MSLYHPTTAFRNSEFDRLSLLAEAAEARRVIDDSRTTFGRPAFAPMLRQRLNQSLANLSRRFPWGPVVRQETSPVAGCRATSTRASSPPA